MDAPVLTAHGPGCYTGISSRRSHRSSPVCQCCGQRLLLYMRAPAASTGGTGTKGMTSAKKMAHGRLSSQSGGEICCAGANRRNLKQNVKKETCQRLITGIVVYGIGRASSSSSSPQTSGRGFWEGGMRFTKSSAAERRFLGEADDLRGESSSGVYRAGRRAIGAYSSMSRLDGGDEAVSSSNGKEFPWQSSSQGDAMGGLHSVADWRSPSAAAAAAAPDFSTEREREGNAHSMAVSGTLRQRENLDLWGGKGVGEVRTSESRHAASAIPASELTKIEELRFSGDLQEGDAGPQVLNLQRALFWLGHLRGLSLTGFFGPETARALREFQYAHGISSSGIWEFASREVLWNYLHPEEGRTQPAEQNAAGVSGYSQLERSSAQFVLADAWHFIKDLTGKARHGTDRVSHSVKKLQSHARTDFLASVSAGTHPALGSGRVGTLFFAVVVLSSIVMLVRIWSGRPQGQAVKRRIMSLRNDVDSTRGLHQTSVRAYRGPHIRSSADLNSRFSTRQRHHTSGRNQISPGNVLDRLVFYDGQVVRGDQYFGNNKDSQRIRTSSSHANEGNVDESLSKWDLAGYEWADHFRRTESSAGAPKNYGVHFRKPEMDPPRRRLLYNQSPTYIGKSFKGSSTEMRSNPSQEQETSPAHPGWASWVRFLFPATFAKEGLHATRKGHSRRIVPGVTASKRSSSLGTGARDVRSTSRFEIERQKMHEQNELELKQKVEDLHRTVQSVEQTRVAAVQALKEEKMHNLELEEKIRHQKQAAVSLQDELRVLKDSHEALLATLRKKYSSSAAARAAAALLYQNWDPSSSSARV